MLEAVKKLVLPKSNLERGRGRIGKAVSVLQSMVNEIEAGQAELEAYCYEMDEKITQCVSSRSEAARAHAESAFVLQNLKNLFQAPGQEA